MTPRCLFAHQDFCLTSKLYHCVYIYFFFSFSVSVFLSLCPPGVSDFLCVWLSAGGGGTDAEGEPRRVGAVGWSGAHSQQHNQGALQTLFRLGGMVDHNTDSLQLLLCKGRSSSCCSVQRNQGIPLPTCREGCYRARVHPVDGYYIHPSPAILLLGFSVIGLEPAMFCFSSLWSSQTGEKISVLKNNRNKTLVLDFSSLRGRWRGPDCHFPPAWDHPALGVPACWFGASQRSVWTVGGPVGHLPERLRGAAHLPAAAAAAGALQQPGDGVQPAAHRAPGPPP